MNYLRFYSFVIVYAVALHSPYLLCSLLLLPLLLFLFWLHSIHQMQWYIFNLGSLSVFIPLESNMCDNSNAMRESKRIREDDNGISAPFTCEFEKHSLSLTHTQAPTISGNFNLFLCVWIWVAWPYYTDYRAKRTMQYVRCTHSKCTQTLWASTKWLMRKSLHKIIPKTFWIRRQNWKDGDDGGGDGTFSFASFIINA